MDSGPHCFVQSRCLRVVLLFQDTRRSYGEDRYQLTGCLEGRVFVLVFTPRDDAMRIISARKANQREVKHYGQAEFANRIEVSLDTIRNWEQGKRFLY